MGRTMFACAVFLSITVAFCWHLTRGFEAWTFDDRRVFAMQAGELVTRLPTVLTSERRAYSPQAKREGTNQVYLVDFIYTSCPTICQVLGSEFYRMQQRLKETGLDSHVRLLSVSIDMQRDSPEQLANYARRHQADGRTWLVGVPLSARELDSALHSLQVVIVKDGLGGYVHNGAIHLVHASGTLLGLYEYDQWSQAVEDASRISGR